MNTRLKQHHSPQLIALACATLVLSACSAPSYDTVSTSEITPPQKAVQQVQDFTKGTDAAVANIDPARLNPTTKSAPKPPPTPALPPPPPASPQHPFPVTPGPTITPIAGHSPGVPTALGTMPAPSHPAPDAPTTSPTTQPTPTTVPAVATTTPAPDTASIASTQPAQTNTQPIQPTTPIPVPPTPNTEPTLDQAMAAIRKQITAHPTLNTTLALALLDSADGKSPDPKASSSLSPTDQKLLTDILTALQGMASATASSTTSLSERAAPLMNAAKTWQADADLTLPKLALASRVDSFGIYTPVPATFTQGVPHTVLIYCEVANFTSQKGDDGWFNTRLSQQETLITDDGILAWRPTAEEVEDRSMNQRHDFYLVKKLIIPETLAAGKYTLRMKVVDHNSNKIAVVTLPLEITAK